MDVTKPLTLLLTGLCVVSWCLPQHHFVFFPTPKTWYEARSYCREVCYDLATVDNMDEMQTLLNLTEGRYDNAVWIGLHRSQNDVWHWSLPDKNLYKEGERAYADIKDQGNNCVIYTDRVLYSRTCHDNRKSVCFDAQKKGKQQYVLSPLLNGWRAARDYCRSHHTDLASVRNAAENDFIQNLTPGLTVYIGAFRDPWEWSDGTYSSMRYWHPSHAVHSQPGQESCVAMMKTESGKWGEPSCEEAHPFICSCPTWKFIKVKIMLKDPGLDLSDPTVQNHLLKQMRKRLDQTVVAHCQLRWKKHPLGHVFVKI